MKRTRIDILLVNNGIAENIDKARRLIMAGVVIADDKRIDKAGDLVNFNAVLRLKDRIPYVSRGGFKLSKAINYFNINMRDKIVLDIGSSTGGFTDVSLKNGASKVYAVDVGKGQLHNSLRTDSRVKVLDNTNFRNIQFETIGEKIDIIVVDVSFISLKKIIPATVQFCKDNTILILLIKPQFEALQEEVDNGGIVTNSKVRLKVSLNIAKFAYENNFLMKDYTVSPITGTKGNIEYLGYFIYYSNILDQFNDEIIQRTICEESCHNSKV